MGPSATLIRVSLNGVYPEREIPRENWLDALGRRIGGAVWRRLQRPSSAQARVVDRVGGLGAAYQEMTDAALRNRAQALKFRRQEQGLDEAVVFETFALVRELARRVLGKRHFDVQVWAAWVLLYGNAAEMNTGEGKTLTATLAAATAALAGIPTHVVTVNDYLVERDASDLGPLYEALGLSVGTILEGMTPHERRVAYACDVTYCSNKELVFDYLKDRISLDRHTGAARLPLERVYDGPNRADGLIMRGLHYAIVDEADSVLVDEARVPVIISRTVDNEEQTRYFEQATVLASELIADADYLIDRRERSVALTERGRDLTDEFAARHSGVWRMRHWREEGIRQALAAKELNICDQHYLVAADKVQIIDEFTGRTMPDRSWEAGLHQLVEAKEGVTITGQREPLAKISYQRFFRRYLRLGGMSGTLREVSGELWNVYRLNTVTIPTNRPGQRLMLPDRVYPTGDAKWRRIIERVGELHRAQRPVLIGTRSVAASEALSEGLAAVGLEHQVLNARQDAEEARVVKDAGRAGQITVATNMAGRGTDIAPSETALAAGGLHVIATERHEAGRIDRQLFGRTARQGDPGSCECMLALDDELLRDHSGVLTRWLAARCAHAEASIPGWLGRHLFRSAQHRVERQHSRIRRELLDMDQRRSDMLAFTGVQE